MPGRSRPGQGSCCSGDSGGSGSGSLQPGGGGEAEGGGDTARTGCRWGGGIAPEISATTCPIPTNTGLVVSGCLLPPTPTPTPTDQPLMVVPKGADSGWASSWLEIAHSAILEDLLHGHADVLGDLTKQHGDHLLEVGLPAAHRGFPPGCERRGSRAHGPQANLSRCSARSRPNRCAQAALPSLVASQAVPQSSSNRSARICLPTLPSNSTLSGSHAASGSSAPSGACPAHAPCHKTCARGIFLLLLIQLADVIMVA
jgi:hypothetical protein